MHKTKNDLPEKTRTEVIAILNARLADSIDLMHQAKQAHWNVKGPSFIALHKLFDEIVNNHPKVTPIYHLKLPPPGFRVSDWGSARGNSPRRSV
jgi:Ferritin-like domain